LLTIERRYTKALHLRATADELVIIKRNRALAYLNTEQYDAALSDTGFPDWESVDFNEKALFRAAEALYKLGRFSESVETMRSLRSHYPNNERAKEMLFRTKYRFQEQETGIYDFKKLQREAKQLRPPHLDHATYVGPIEVRQTESKGRGLFVTKAVKAGELLLCEKAFCHAFADENGMTGSTTTLLMNIETGKGFVGAQANLITSIVHKLHRNPSIAHKFTELFHGDYKSAATLSHEAKGIVDT
jgi:tetratricopeptide (TPR) repeat protein